MCSGAIKLRRTICTKQWIFNTVVLEKCLFTVSHFVAFNQSSVKVLLCPLISFHIFVLPVHRSGKMYASGLKQVGGTLPWDTDLNTENYHHHDRRIHCWQKCKWNGSFHSRLPTPFLVIMINGPDFEFGMKNFVQQNPLGLFCILFKAASSCQWQCWKNICLHVK